MNVLPTLQKFSLCMGIDLIDNMLEEVVSKKREKQSCDVSHENGDFGRSCSVFCTLVGCTLLLNQCTIFV